MKDTKVKEMFNTDVEQSELVMFDTEVVTKSEVPVMFEMFESEHKVMPGMVEIEIGATGNVAVYSDGTATKAVHFKLLQIDAPVGAYVQTGTEFELTVKQYFNNIESTLKSYNNLTNSPEMLDNITKSIFEDIYKQSWFQRYSLTNKKGFNERLEYSLKSHSSVTMDRLDDIVSGSVKLFEKHNGDTSHYADFELTSAAVASVVGKTEEEYEQVLDALTLAYVDYHADSSYISDTELSILNPTNTMSKTDIAKISKYIEFRAVLLGAPQEHKAPLSLLVLSNKREVKRLADKYYNGNTVIANINTAMALRTVHRDNPEFQQMLMGQIHQLSFVNSDELMKTPLAEYILEASTWVRSHAIVSDRIAKLYINLAVARQFDDFDKSETIFSETNYSEKLSDNIYDSYSNRISMEEETQQILIDANNLTNEEIVNYQDTVDKLDEDVGIFHNDLVKRNSIEKVRNIHRQYSIEDEIRDHKEVLNMEYSPYEMGEHGTHIQNNFINTHQQYIDANDNIATKVEPYQKFLVNRIGIKENVKELAATVLGGELYDEKGNHVNKGKKALSVQARLLSKAYADAALFPSVTYDDIHNLRYDFIPIDMTMYYNPLELTKTILDLKETFIALNYDLTQKLTSGEITQSEFDNTFVKSYDNATKTAIMNKIGLGMPEVALAVYVALLEYDMPPEVVVAALSTIANNDLHKEINTGYVEHVQENEVTATQYNERVGYLKTHDNTTKIEKESYVKATDSYLDIKTRERVKNLDRNMETYENIPLENLPIDGLIDYMADTLEISYHRGLKGTATEFSHMTGLKLSNEVNADTEFNKLPLEEMVKYSIDSTQSAFAIVVNNLRNKIQGFNEDRIMKAASHAIDKLNSIDERIKEIL